MHNSQPNVDEVFPCTSCGKCCRQVGNHEHTRFLDRGDSVCRYLQLESNLCSIYEQRPIVCRVYDYHQQYLSHEITWYDFRQMNIEICSKL